jgi:hypothetical protein
MKHRLQHVITRRLADLCGIILVLCAAAFAWLRSS